MEASQIQVRPNNRCTQINCVTSITKQFQQINFIQEELMDYNSKEYYLYCNQQGHHNQIIEFICIYSECGENRQCCNTCIQQHRHDPIALSLKYLIGYDVFKKHLISENYFGSYFFTEITEEMINSVIDQEIITISISNDKINTKICSYQGECRIEASKFIISNNKKLMVKMDRERLRLFHIQNNFKIMRIKKAEGNTYSIVFSTSDKFLYLCQKDRIIQLDIQSNLTKTLIIQLDIQSNLTKTLIKYQYDDNSQLKCISDTKLLFNYQKYIHIIDFQQNMETHKINAFSNIQSIDFQLKSNNIVIFNQCGIYSWNTSGQPKFDKPDYHYKLNDETNVAFFGNQDKLITIDYNKILIWNIDYINKTIGVEKIIVSPQQWLIRAYGLNQNQIHFIINDFIAGYSLESNKLKIIRLLDNSDLIDDLTEKEFQIISRARENVILQDSIYFYYTKKLMIIRNNAFKI